MSNSETLLDNEESTQQNSRHSVLRYSKALINSNHNVERLFCRSITSPPGSTIKISNQKQIVVRMARSLGRARMRAGYKCR